MKQLVVRHHRPYVVLLTLLLVLAILSGLGWLAYRAGVGDAARAIRGLELELAALVQQREQHEQSIAQLREQGIVLTRELQVDQTASVHIDTELARLNDEVAELRGELEFYRGIVVADEERVGLSARGFILTAVGSGNEYQYRFVLTKVPNDGRQIQGSITLVVHGEEQGVVRDIEISKPNGSDRDTGTDQFRFKYFQSINGRLHLPEGFTPSKVTIALNPKGKQKKPIVEAFDWIIEES